MYCSRHAINGQFEFNSKISQLLNSKPLNVIPANGKKKSRLRGQNKATNNTESGAMKKQIKLLLKY